MVKSNRWWPSNRDLNRIAIEICPPLFLVPMEIGMNALQWTSLVFLIISWWHHKCVTSQVMKVYFNFNEILWVLKIKLLFLSKSCFYDIALYISLFFSPNIGSKHNIKIWRHVKDTAVRKLKSAYVKCLKCFF